MQRPIAHQIIATSRPLQQSSWATIFVAALHFALIYALITGLTVPIMKVIPNVIDAIVLPPQKHSVVLPPPPTASTPKSNVDTIPPPVFTIEGPRQPVINVETSPDPQPPPTTPSIKDELVRAIAGTHTTPDYPVLSRRLGEQGTVLLHIAIADNGRIENVNVVRSSGYSRLDEAAREWVMLYWRYLPATHNGKAIPSAADASVVFNLKNAM